MPPPRARNAASSSFNTGALASPQNTIFAPACISRSARDSKSLSMAVAQPWIASISSLVACPPNIRSETASLSSGSTFLLEIDATRTVSEDGGNSAMRAPPSSITVVIVPTHSHAPPRARLESSPSSHRQLHTAANQPIRNVMPHKPVTERIWSNAKLPYCEYATDPHVAYGPRDKKYSVAAHA